MLRNFHIGSFGEYVFAGKTGPNTGEWHRSKSGRGGGFKVNSEPFGHFRKPPEGL